MMTDKQHALELYTPPFRYYRGYIFDANNNMIADNPCEDAVVRIRGWGRISYMPEPEKLQDAVGELIAEALNEYYDKRKD
jgi:hypothetical protein